MARRRVLPPGVQMKDIFAQAAKLCAEKVKNLPRRQKGATYKACIRETIKATLAQYHTS